MSDSNDTDVSRLLDAAFEAHLRGQPARAVKYLIWALDLDHTLRDNPAVQSLVQAYSPLPTVDLLADEMQRKQLLAEIEAEYDRKKSPIIDELYLCTFRSRDESWE